MSINPSSTGCCVPLLDGTISTPSGIVKSVNLILPDGTGNVSIVKEDIPGVTLTDTPTFANVYTTDEVVRLGSLAGQTGQGIHCVAVGTGAGTTNQGTLSVAIGRNAGGNTQSSQSVAVGRDSGQITQGSQATAIGPYAGQTNQGTNGVAVGYQSGFLNQNAGSVAVGPDSGCAYQEAQCVAVGVQAQLGAGKIAHTGHTSSVAIGFQAQHDSKQLLGAIGIGKGAGSLTQGQQSIAIGYQTSDTIPTGRQSIVMGMNTNVGGINAIVLNSSGVDPNITTATDCFIVSTQGTLPATVDTGNTYIDPIEEGVGEVGDKVLLWNTTTKRVHASTSTQRGTFDTTSTDATVEFYADTDMKFLYNYTNSQVTYLTVTDFGELDSTFVIVAEGKFDQHWGGANKTGGPGVSGYFSDGGTHDVAFNVSAVGEVHRLGIRSSDTVKVRYDMTIMFGSSVTYFTVQRQ